MRAPGLGAQGEGLKWITDDFGRRRHNPGMETKPERHRDDPSFFDSYTTEEWTQLRPGHSKRRERMLEVIAEAYKVTKAPTVEEFIEEAHAAIRSKTRMTTPQSETGHYVTEFMWSALTAARAEIAKFPERMRKRRSENSN